MFKSKRTGIGLAVVIVLLLMAALGAGSYIRKTYTIETVYVEGNVHYTEDVDILSPDTVKIIVYEKALTGCVRYLDTYIYFDRDGYAVESSAVRTVGVPQIVGLRFDHMVLGEKLPVEDDGIFNSILVLTNLLQKYSLTPDKIYFNREGEITLYFEDTKIALGNEPSALEDKLMLLPGFLPELEGKSGILQMQAYDEDSGKYTFKPGG